MRFIGLLMVAGVIGFSHSAEGQAVEWVEGGNNSEVPENAMRDAELFALEILSSTTIEMLDAIEQAHEDNQQDLDDLLAALSACDSHLSDKARLDAAMGTELLKINPAHAQCRHEEATVKAQSDAWPPPRCAQFIQIPVEFWRCARSPNTVPEPSPPAYIGKTAECDGIQQSLEITSCSWMTEVVAECERYSQCYIGNRGNLTKAENEARLQEADRQKLWLGLKGIQCLANALQDGEDTHTCRSRTHSTSGLNLRYSSNPPSIASCVVDQAVPCSARFTETYYASLPPLAPSADCTPCN
jgi:hypothetical protein